MNDDSNVVQLFRPKRVEETGAFECPKCECQWFSLPVVVDLGGAVTAHGVAGVCIECGTRVTFI